MESNEATGSNKTLIEQHSRGTDPPPVPREVTTEITPSNDDGSGLAKDIPKSGETDDVSSSLKFKSKVKKEQKSKEKFKCNPGSGPCCNGTLSRRGLKIFTILAALLLGFGIIQLLMTVWYLVGVYGLNTPGYISAMKECEKLENQSNLPRIFVPPDMYLPPTNLTGSSEFALCRASSWSRSAAILILVCSVLMILTGCFLLFMVTLMKCRWRWWWKVCLASQILMMLFSVAAIILMWRAANTEALNEDCEPYYFEDGVSACGRPTNFVTHLRRDCWVSRAAFLPTISPIYVLYFVILVLTFLYFLAILVTGIILLIRCRDPNYVPKKKVHGPPPPKAVSGAPPGKADGMDVEEDGGTPNLGKIRHGIPNSSPFARRRRRRKLMQNYKINKVVPGTPQQSGVPDVPIWMLTGGPDPNTLTPESEAGGRVGFSNVSYLFHSHLYVDNLPQGTTRKQLLNIFDGATKIDIQGRLAVIEFDTQPKAAHAYTFTRGAQLNGVKLNVLQQRPQYYQAGEKPRFQKIRAPHWERRSQKSSQKSSQVSSQTSSAKSAKK